MELKPVRIKPTLKLLPFTDKLHRVSEAAMKGVMSM